MFGEGGQKQARVGNGTKKMPGALILPLCQASIPTGKHSSHHVLVKRFPHPLTTSHRLKNGHMGNSPKAPTKSATLHPRRWRQHLVVDGDDGVVLPAGLAAGGVRDLGPVPGVVEEEGVPGPGVRHQPVEGLEHVGARGRDVPGPAVVGQDPHAGRVGGEAAAEEHLLHLQRVVGAAPQLTLLAPAQRRGKLVEKCCEACVVNVCYGPPWEKKSECRFASRNLRTLGFQKGNQGPDLRDCGGPCQTTFSNSMKNIPVWMFGTKPLQRRS